MGPQVGKIKVFPGGVEELVALIPASIVDGVVAGGGGLIVLLILVGVCVGVGEAGVVVGVEEKVLVVLVKTLLVVFKSMA
ncbi:hypothetical protein AUK10_00880 [Candidatus Gracilibacteria bacterium CG2_30_37_12]|nr:MAG: hypothetical protein AUK10_00880 [Candidatus Gracilibacteria bacterium CG2_30_37_12]